jgi:hypothetical protein
MFAHSFRSHIKLIIPPPPPLPPSVPPVEEYLALHSLEEKLNDIVNEVVKDRPENPFLLMSQKLKEAQGLQNAIEHVDAREVLNGKGFPTLIVEVTTSKGVFTASVAKTIPNAREKRRADDTNIDEEIINVRDILGPELKGLDPCDQKAVDQAIMNADKISGRELGSHICSLSPLLCSVCLITFCLPLI